MTFQVEATYRDGALYPKAPLHLPEGAAVVVSIDADSGGPPHLASNVLLGLRSFRGMLNGLSREEMLVDRRQGLQE